MSMTLQIHQENCVGCSVCVELSEGEIAINEEGKAYFVHSETPNKDVGNMEREIGDNVKESCPESCIEEIG